MKFKRILSLCLICILGAACLPVVGRAQASAASETLKVGFFSFPGYHMQDETGRRSGYGYEVLQLIADHTDWNYQYLWYELSYADCLDKLERGELDLVTSVSDTPERREKFLYSEKEIGTNSTIFTVKSGNDKVVKGDYSTYDNLVIGMLEDNSKNDVFAAFAEGKF